jgi:hypothetical protein
MDYGYFPINGLRFDSLDVLSRILNRESLEDIGLLDPIAYKKGRQKSASSPRKSF